MAKLVDVISDKETQAHEDAARARAGWATKGFLEERARKAMEPVYRPATETSPAWSLYDENVLPYVDQLDRLQGTELLHSIAWHTNSTTRHFDEVHVEFDPEAGESVDGRGRGRG